MARLIRPLHDRVVIKRVEEKEQTIGSLYVPHTAREKPWQGEVVDGGKGEAGARIKNT